MKNNIIERSCIRSYVDDDKLQRLQEEINSNIDFSDRQILTGSRIGVAVTKVIFN